MLKIINTTYSTGRVPTVCDLKLKYQSGTSKHGRGLYILEVPFKVLPLRTARKISWPGTKTMERLAKEHLSCEYREDPREKEGLTLTFTINTRLPLEKRAAFMAAVATHTGVEWQ